MTSPSPLSGRRFEDQMVTDRFMVWSPSRSKLVEEVIRAARQRLNTSRICDLCYEDGCDRIECPCLSEDATGTEQTCHDLDWLARSQLRKSLSALDASLDSGGGGDAGDGLGLPASQGMSGGDARPDGTEAR